MQTSTVRIDEESNEILDELAERKSLPKRKIIREALLDYRRKHFLKQCAEAYKEFKSRTDHWNQEDEDRKIWNSTLNDGLEGDKSSR